MDEHIRAHAFSIHHREQVQASRVCGCFYCRGVFSPSEITDWVDEDESGNGRTALCPRCGIDAVLGSEAGFPLTPEFLNHMHYHWF